MLLVTCVLEKYTGKLITHKTPKQNQADGPLEQASMYTHECLWGAEPHLLGPQKWVHWENKTNMLLLRI